MRKRHITRIILRGGAVLQVVALIAIAWVALPPASASAATVKVIPANKVESTIVQRLGPLKIATGNTTRGVKGKTITIAGVADVTINGTNAIPGACDGAKAAFAASNRAGGVNGYKINYVDCSDDGFNPTTANQLTATAIVQKKVFAMVPWTSAGSAVLLNQDHVPYIGFGANTRAYCGWNNRQFGFSVTSSEGCIGSLNGASLVGSLGLVAYLQGARVKASTVKIALLGENDPSVIANLDSAALMAKSLGMKVVYNAVPIPGSTSPQLTDYSPIIHAIVASGANYVFDAVGGASVLPVAGGLKSAGWHGGFEQFVFSDSSFLKIPAVAQAMDGAYALTPQVGSAVFPSATTRTIQSNLRAVGAPTALTLGSLSSYGSAELFLAALKKVTGPLTTEKFAAVLNRGFTFAGVGNAVCPSTWPQAHLASENCGAFVRIGPTTSITPLLNLGQYGNAYLMSG